MTDRFLACLAFTLQQEGGFVNDPRDPGGATNKGITLATYRRWVPDATEDALRHISDADVARIYRAGYWSPIRGADLPAGVDLMAFDFGVNAGPGRSAKMLQRAAGVAEDGAIGPVTLAAVRDVPVAEMVRLLSDLQRTYYATLANFGFFGRGWLARTERRVAKALEAAGGRE